MRPIKFWLLYTALVVAGTLGYCRIAGAQTTIAQVQAPRSARPNPPVVKLGTAYHAEYHKPKSDKPKSDKPKPPQKPKPHG